MNDQIMVVLDAENGHTTTLLTAGKYCDKDILVNANNLAAKEYTDGLGVGKQKAYDAFWNAYQQNGNRTDYNSAFKGVGWNSATFDPKYKKFQPVNANNMFNSSLIEGSLIEMGIEIDTSKCTDMTSMFGVATKITEIGEIDMRNISSPAGLFGYMTNLEKIEMLILDEDGSQVIADSCFANDAKLSYIRIKNDDEHKSKIGNNLNMKDCKNLSKESIESIVAALSTSVSGKTLTLHSDVKNNFTSDEWTDLKNTKSNWTIKPD